jgi:hypothetical protein
VSISAIVGASSQVIDAAASAGASRGAATWLIARRTKVSASASRSVVGTSGHRASIASTSRRLAPLHDLTALGGEQRGQTRGAIVGQQPAPERVLVGDGQEALERGRVRSPA